MTNKDKIKGFYKLKPSDKLTLTGKQLKEFTEYNRKEAIAERGLIKIEDVIKIIEKSKYTNDDGEIFIIEARLKQQLQTLKSKCIMSINGKCNSYYSPLKCNGIDIPDDCTYALSKCKHNVYIQNCDICGDNSGKCQHNMY